MTENLRFSIGLSLLLVMFMVVAGQYAAITPLWQVPDEPAHYNYIRHIAETGRLPVLQPGDYDQAYLSRLTAERFPPELSIDSVQYEGHQPPLYYLLATPLFLLTDGNVLLLRQLSALLGMGLVFCAAQAVRVLFPGRAWLALGVAGFVAFVPQHVAMLAGVNNDSLALALLAAGLWALFWAIGQPGGSLRPWVVVGAIVALVIATKTTVYLFAPVAALGLLLTARTRQGWAEGWSAKQFWQAAAVLVLPAVLVAGLWWGRNVMVYGWPDFLGLIRHDEVVVGQPRTADWILEFGVPEVLRRLLFTTFNSFWGQFGWMGVPMPGRYYQALWVFCGLLFIGALIAITLRPTLTAIQQRGLVLLATVAGLALLAYSYYNLSYVQHQGRYLFPALIPVGVLVMAGLWGWWAALRRLIGQRWPRVAQLPTGLLLLALAPLPVLCLWALYRFILPSLTG